MTSDNVDMKWTIKYVDEFVYPSVAELLEYSSSSDLTTCQKKCDALSTCAAFNRPKVKDC